MKRRGSRQNGVGAIRMRHLTASRSAYRRALVGMLALGGLTTASAIANADEGGVGLWVPGFFGSLSAAPLGPGASFASIYYHTSVKAGSDVAFARQVNGGRITTNFTGSVNINLRADVDLGLAVPSYTFAQPFLGGQAFAVSGGRADEIDGFGDLGPQFNLRWNNGVHNYMTYVATNIPIGRYDATRLANLGIGHNAVDAGGGYTYFNPQTGREFSAVLGFTYNFENAHTQYQNGIDAHLDWGASQFLTKQVQLGLVGYAYQQLSCDSGAGDRVGCFESRVFGIGPQVGYILPLGTTHQAYFNLKGYKEFGAEHRPEGWNVWFTVAISPLAAPPPARQ